MDDFVEYIKSKCEPREDFSEVNCVRYFLQVETQLKEKERQIKKQKRAYDLCSPFLIISTSIIHIASCIIILVLLFTSLRAVPEGVL